MTIAEQGKPFIDRRKLYDLINGEPPLATEVNDILNRSLRLHGLSLDDAAKLLQVQDETCRQNIMLAAQKVKLEIYGKRMVLFAPIYTGNACINNCTYCAFRKDNQQLRRKILTMDEIAQQTRILLQEGHKRVLLICGETPRNNIDYMVEAIRTTYAVREREGKDYIRRVNVELAPMSVSEFQQLHKEKIGTYVCFQETYDPDNYPLYHPRDTQKGDYLYRLLVMDRAMEAGIEDVGIGALFGLSDYRFEVLALLEHAAHLERAFGCGPHTISVPRIEPASGAPHSENIPFPVSDRDFEKLVAVLRLALPYTGIILSTREPNDMRNRLFQYGVSQISAGSRTNPGAYTHEETQSDSQFSLGDHRSLDEVIASLIDAQYIPSFCTGCYRKGRIGNDFMDLAKPGLIKHFCFPNAIFTFKEYLEDFASAETKRKGLLLIKSLIAAENDPALQAKISENIARLDHGERDVYL